jgi:hypothetical protein
MVESAFDCQQEEKTKLFFRRIKGYVDSLARNNQYYCRFEEEDTMKLFLELCYLSNKNNSYS